MKYLLFIVLAVALGNVRAQSGPSKRTLRPYDKVITADAEAWRGPFAVYKARDSFFLEIPDTLLGRRMMLTVHYVKTPYTPASLITGEQGYPGNAAKTLLGEAHGVYYFARGAMDVINMQKDNPSSQAEPNSELSASLALAQADAVSDSFPVVAYGKDGRSVVVNATSFIKFSTLTNYDESSPKFKYNGRSHVEYIKAYPINIELGIYREYGDGKTYTYNLSFLLLPEEPMRPRLADRRVGYFPPDLPGGGSAYFADDQQEVERRKFVERWRVEPKPEDRERWQRGELVEPAKPIVYYIDPNTPEKWVKYLIQGVNDWQKAFEQAGFKNAIMAREWPYGDSICLNDARYSFICYLPSTTINAAGVHLVDPRTGEVIQSHVSWYHNVMAIMDIWYRPQLGATDPGAQKAEFDDELIGRLIRFVASHEVGHTLGLAHNFGSSSQTPVEKMRDKDWLKVHGHTASIMDYARFNYVVQPEDSIPRELLWPHVGEYDRWAIEWGYKYTGLEVEADKKVMSRLTTDSLAMNPRLWFGSQEIDHFRRDVDDPRCQTEDLGDNDMLSNSYGIMNLKRVLPNLPSWTREKGGLYDNLADAYHECFAQYQRYVNHVRVYIGGVERTYRSEDSEGDVYVPTSKALQRQALTFLDEQLFTTPLWLLDTTITTRVMGPRVANDIEDLQHKTVRSLINTIATKLTAERLTFGDSLSYTPEDVLADLHHCIWGCLAEGKPMDAWRRDLQKTYVHSVIGHLIAGDPSFRENDFGSLAQADLRQLKKEVGAALLHYTGGEDQAHLQSVLQTIRLANNAPL